MYGLNKWNKTLKKSSFSISGQSLNKSILLLKNFKNVSEANSQISKQFEHRVEKKQIFVRHVHPGLPQIVPYCPLLSSISLHSVIWYILDNFCALNNRARYFNTNPVKLIIKRCPKVYFLLKIIVTISLRNRRLHL